MVAVSGVFQSDLMVARCPIPPVLAWRRLLVRWLFLSADRLRCSWRLSVNEVSRRLFFLVFLDVAIVVERLEPVTPSFAAPEPLLHSLRRTETVLVLFARRFYTVRRNTSVAYRIARLYGMESALESDRSLPISSPSSSCLTRFHCRPSLCLPDPWPADASLQGADAIFPCEPWVKKCWSRDSAGTLCRSWWLPPLHVQCRTVTVLLTSAALYHGRESRTREIRSSLRCCGPVNLLSMSAIVRCDRSVNPFVCGL